MVKTICDICGEEINEDYTRYHYSYNLDFEGQKPHQTSKQEYCGSTYTTTTLMYYTDPKSWHLNLCGSCGSAFERMIDDGIKKLRNVHKKINVEGLTELMKDAIRKDAVKPDLSAKEMFLMNWAEWNRNHPDEQIEGVEYQELMNCSNKITGTGAGIKITIEDDK